MLIIPFCAFILPSMKSRNTDSIPAAVLTTTNIRLKGNAESLGLEMGPCSVAQHD